MNQNTCQYCKQQPSVMIVQLQNPQTGTKDNVYLCTDCYRSRLDEIIQSFSAGFNRNQNGTPNPVMQENEEETALEKYTIDLTAKADHNELDPVIGRDAEVNRLIEILCRRNKNNPVIIGEPGVGKTAVIEGLAQKISSGDVPEKIKYKSVLSLDLTALMAGTKFRGEFEERMHRVIEEVVEDGDVILFVDELHMLMGAGATQDGNMDAANILKPHLARGSFQLIGATTLEEYRKIEKDAAFSRRFQSIHLQEPNLEHTRNILSGLKPYFEDFHGVKYSSDALDACVRLADRYINDRFMPDKAIDLMDEVGSRVVLNHKPTEKQQIALSRLEDEIQDLYEKAHELAIENQRYEESAKLKAQAILKEKQLKKKKQISITVKHIEEVLENMTGIPVRQLSKQERDGLKDLKQTLSSQVIGQDEAIDVLVRAVRRKRMNIRNTKRPTVLFFAGPTGVGKTESAKALAKALFGDEKSFIRFDMSEFMEEHASSKLIGSPPGYIGHDQAGQLTEQVRRKPYSIILLDEFEKAHPKVSNMFLQVFDDGRLTDSQGKTVDFSNSIIIMTSNIGAKATKSVGFGSSNAQKEHDHYMKALHQRYAPEFLNRIDEIVPFRSLTEKELIQIVDIMLIDFHNGLKEKNISLEVTEKAKLWLAKKGFNPDMGARPLARVITRHVEDPLTEKILDTSSSAFVFDLKDEENELELSF